MEIKPPRSSRPRTVAGRAQRLLVQEKELTRARDALAAQRRRMPWLPVEKDYSSTGQGPASACSTCSRAVASSSSTAPSPSRAWSAGPTTRAMAAR